MAMFLPLLALGGVAYYALKPAWQAAKSALEMTSARSDQMRELTGEDPARKEAEARAAKDVKIATVAVALSMGSTSLPILILPSIGVFLYLTSYLYKDACKALVEERTVRISVVHSLVVTGVLFGGFVTVASGALWMFMGARWIMVRVEDRFRRRLANLFGEQPHEVFVLTDQGAEMSLPFEQLEIGDTLVAVPGEIIPIDGVVEDGHALVDQHLLTGESQPVEKARGDTVFTSTMVVTGRLYIKVERTGRDTVTARIGDILNRTADYKQSIQREAAELADQLAVPMLALGAFSLPTAGLNSTLGALWNVPGLRMELMGPLGMLNFLHVASKNGILIKDGRSLELLQEIDTIVFDKTGTLTLDEQYVYRLHPANGLHEDELLEYAAAAEHRQTHPIARAIVNAARERGLRPPKIDEAHVKIGYGLKVGIEGRIVRVGSERYMDLEGITVPPAIRELEGESHAAGRALVMVAIDDDLGGAIELQTTSRPEAEEIVRRLRARGFDIYIISGDHEGPTRRLAQELGVDKYFAETLPENKAQLIEDLQAEGRSVCFVGDGINDSIALKKANVSISLRGAATVATDTAQIVLMDESLSQLDRILEIAEKYSVNQKQSFGISIVPSTVSLIGALTLGWGFATAVVIGQVELLSGLYNVMRPLMTPGDGTRDEEGADE